MKRQRKQSLGHGAAILAGAGIAVKILGACYKIPLGAMLGAEGMASFTIAYNVYAFLFTVSTAGVPAAVSKVVSGALAKGEYVFAATARKVSEIIFGLTGALGSCIMFFGANEIALLLGCRGASSAIRAIAPAVFFVSFSAVRRGWFQGNSDMYPTAASELLEASGKLVFGMAIAAVLQKSGAASESVGAGALAGVSAGAFLSAVYFLAKKLPAGRKGNIRFSKTAKQIIRLTVPITLGAAVMSLTNLIDSALVINILKASGESAKSANRLFGSYSLAATLFNLPTSLTATFATAVIPAASALFAVRNVSKLSQTTESVLRVSALAAIPAAFGMAALSVPLCAFLYGSVGEETIEVSGKLLACLSAGVPFLAVTSVTNALHQSFGNAKAPVRHLICGAAVKIASNLALVSNPRIGVTGAAVSTVLCYATTAVLNIITLKKYRFLKFSLLKTYIKPTLIGLITFFAVRAAKTVSDAFLFSKLSTILSGFAGLAVALAGVFLLGAYTETDESLIFGGKKILKFLTISRKI